MPQLRRFRPRARSGSLLLLILAALVLLVARARAPASGGATGPGQARSPATTGAGGRPPDRAVAAAGLPSASAPPPEAAAPADAGPASCSIPERGSGSYGGWRSLPLGRLLVPASRRAGFLDLLVHFHGAEAVRALLAPADLGLVIVAIDAGEGSQRYAEAFAAPSALGELVESVRRALAEQDGAAPRLGRLVVSAWSAGYGAVHQILLRRPEGLDAVILLDGLHASYGPDGGLGVEAIEPFLDFARRARDGKAMMVVTHSEIRPVGYASTSETASYLLHELGAQRRYAGLVALEGVEQKTSFAQGGLRVRGYTGTTREAHCALLRMLPPILRDDVLPGLRQRTKNSQTPKPDSW